MQNRYVGDVGDFAKYGLLRAIMGRKRLGVAWYLHPDAGPIGDGKHADYLCRPAEFRHLDCKLFDEMKIIREGDLRSVAAVEKSGILGNAAFADEYLGVERIAVGKRDLQRRQWFARVKDRLADCDFIFADPDNGLYPDDKFNAGQKVNWKRIPLAEATDLAAGRTAVIYHHNTRYPGGHCKEIRYWMSRLPGCNHAFHWKRWSSRTFFIINPDRETEHLLGQFARRWRKCGELIPKAPN